MRTNRRILMALFLGAALLSAWLSPASSKAPDLHPSQALAIQETISVLLWEEDSQIYLPIVRR